MLFEKGAIFVLPTCQKKAAGNDATVLNILPYKAYWIIGDPIKSIQPILFG